MEIDNNSENVPIRNIKKSEPAKRKKLVNCELCDMQFQIKRKLNQHKKVHITPMDFKCNVCGTVMKNRKSMTKHTNTHTNESFKCDICRAILKRKDNLLVHIRNHYTNKTVTCPVCKIETTKTYNKYNCCRSKKNKRNGNTQLV